jgi:hypothetical protein
MFRLFLTECSHRDSIVLTMDELTTTLQPLPDRMLCLSLLKTNVPCETPLDGLRTTCRRKYCVAFRNSRPSYQAHHEQYKELIKASLFADAKAHREQCIVSYMSDAHIAYLERRVALQASIYQEHVVQQIRERKAEDELKQSEALIGNLQGMSLGELQATQFTLEYGAGADVGEDLADAYPDDEL